VLEDSDFKYYTFPFWYTLKNREKWIKQRHNLISRDFVVITDDGRGAFWGIKAPAIKKRSYTGHLTSVGPPLTHSQEREISKTSQDYRMFFSFHIHASLYILTIYAGSSWDNLKWKHFLRQFVLCGAFELRFRDYTFSLGSVKMNTVTWGPSLEVFKICLMRLLKESLSSRGITDWQPSPSSHPSNSF
jgi:hypothetical protein